MEFPCQIFPDPIRNLIDEAKHGLSFPTDFTGMGILFAASVAIGNAFQIKVKSMWNEGASLYMVLVGQTGTNKTHPLRLALEPLQDIQSEYHKTNRMAAEEWEQLPDPERKRTRFPCPKQIIVVDATMEALQEILSNNPRGIGLSRDELTGWLYDQNKYRHGSDLETFLEAWSGVPIIINRKGRPAIDIRNPFISLIGTTQPELLTKFFQGGKNVNGFADRFMFAMPHGLKKQYMTDNVMSMKVVDEYKCIIKRLAGFSMAMDPKGNICPHVLLLTADARERLIQWVNTNADRINGGADPSDMRGVLSKCDIILPRFALILELLNSATTETIPLNVSLDSLEKAIELIEYHIDNATRVRAYVRDGMAHQFISEQQRRFFMSLSNTFTRNDIEEIADRERLHRSSVERHLQHFLKNGLVIRIKQGYYEKCA